MSTIFVENCGRSVRVDSTFDAGNVSVYQYVNRAGHVSLDVVVVERHGEREKARHHGSSSSSYKDALQKAAISAGFFAKDSTCLVTPWGSGYQATLDRESAKTLRARGDDEFLTLCRLVLKASKDCNGSGSGL